MSHGTTFGAVAEAGTINIVHACRFVLELEAYDDDGLFNWPAGVSVYFEDGNEWAATVSGALATWNVPAATAAAVAPGARWWINMKNAGGNDPDPLYVGRVSAQ